MWDNEEDNNGSVGMWDNEETMGGWEYKTMNKTIMRVDTRVVEKRVRVKGWKT